MSDLIKGNLGGNGSLVMGEFNSEQYWRNPVWAKLPEIVDRSSQNIIRTMDELLFLFCEATDVLITRFKFNDTFKSYLNTLGFGFICNSRSIQQEPGEGEMSIFQLIDAHRERIRDLWPELAKGRDFAPYSLIPGFESLLQDAKVNFSGPDIEVVKKVNSKVYSGNLSKELGLQWGGTVVESSRELWEKGERLLENGAFLIKDPQGVSGKGNFLINSGQVLKRIVKYLEGQERKGLLSLFVIEPFLNKAKDFSCGLTIGADGAVKLASVQEILNRNFAYGGSYTADISFVEELQSKKYFEVVRAVAGQLYTDGYFGPVCIDSMRLTSGEIVPLVEINARKSMGMLNHRVDCYLSRYGLKGNLTFLNLGARAGLNFDQVAERLDDAGLLFYPERKCGVMLLSANTLAANQKFPGSEATGSLLVTQGRLYLSLIAPDHRQRESLLQSVRSVFKEMSCSIYN